MRLSVTINGALIMNKTSLTKGQQRKLNALRKSLGDEIADDAFSKWLETQPKKTAIKDDPVALKIQEALAPFEGEKSFNLGRKGYTITRSRGKISSGFSVTKNK